MGIYRIVWIFKTFFSGGLMSSGFMSDGLLSSGVLSGGLMSGTCRQQDLNFKFDAHTTMLSVHEICTNLMNNLLVCVRS